MSQPRFTVVVAAFNAAATIGSAIGSILAQTRQDFEIVVVDDGSTDETAARAASAGDARLTVVEQKNGGPSAARNAGIAAARGDYVSVLDADDLWLPEYLDVMGRALDVDHDAAFAYTDAWVLDDTTGKIRRRSAMSYQRPLTTVPDAGGLFLELLERNFVYTSVTARRVAIEGVGGYDETLWTGEDWDLWLRIARGGGRAVRIPQILAIHRQREGSLTSNESMMMSNVCEVYRRLVADPVLDDETRALARRYLHRSERVLHRLQRPTARTRLRRSGGKVKRRALRRRQWYERPPPEVERVLRVVGEIR